MAMPWVAWLVLGLVVLILLMWSSLRHFRGNVRREFCEYLARTQPEYEIVSARPGRIEIKPPGCDSVYFFPHRLYQAMSHINLRDTPAKEQVFQQFVAALTEAQAASASPAEAKDLPRIKPRIIPLDYLQSLTAEHGAVIPHVDCSIEGLAIAFVLDGQSHVRYLSDGDLKALNINEARALESALANLRATFDRAIVRGIMNRPGVAGVVKTGDTFDAARILLVPEYLEVSEQIVALIPDRDTLILVCPPFEGKRKHLEKMARQADGERLYSTPLLVTREGFRPL